MGRVQEAPITHLLLLKGGSLCSVWQVGWELRDGGLCWTHPKERLSPLTRKAAASTAAPMLAGAPGTVPGTCG